LKETLIYKRVNDCAISADVYDRGPNSPVLLYVHGGALIFGTRAWLSAEQIEFFGGAGYSIVNIDYRLAPETDFESIVEDILDAIEWIGTEIARRYDFDTDRLVLMGSSAGGYLSLLMGVIAPTKPKAIVSLYGYGDLTGDWYALPSEHYGLRPTIDRLTARERVGEAEQTEGPWARFDFYLYCRQHGVWVQEVVGLDREKDRDALLRYNPIDQATADYPPTIFIHGDQDTDVPYEQSVLMHEKLKEQGVFTRLITMEGADHAFDQHFNAPEVREAFNEILSFLETVLKK